MTSICSKMLVAVVALLSANAASAFDPVSTDILAFRLGMGPDDVARTLDGQGIGPTAREEHYQPCAGSPRCLTSLKAKTRDGWLLLSFSQVTTGRAVISRIDYTFNGHGAGEPAIIRAAVLDRFGPPASRGELAWCDHPTDSGNCPSDRAILTFQPGPGVTSTLTLTSGTPN